MGFGVFIDPGHVWQFYIQREREKESTWPAENMTVFVAKNNFVLAEQREDSGGIFGNLFAV